jgi:hypothetical protein
MGNPGLLHKTPDIKPLLPQDGGHRTAREVPSRPLKGYEKF